MNERIVALDIGDRRIGIAVSDPGRIIASPLEVYTRIGYGPDVKHILEICRRQETVYVLSGLPLNMDGTEGFQAEKTRNFCAQLEKAGLIVYYQDERLTTVTAEEALIEGGVRRFDRKSRVDMVAAAVILQQWLETLERDPEPVSGGRIYRGKRLYTMNENENIIELIDEETNEPVRFEMIASLEEGDSCYLALIPADADNEEECEVVFMEVQEGDDDNDSFISVTDEELNDKLFDKLMLLMEDGDPEEEDGEEA